MHSNQQSMLGDRLRPGVRRCMSAIASNAQESVLKAAASEVRLELPLDICQQVRALCRPIT